MSAPFGSPPPFLLGPDLKEELVDDAVLREMKRLFVAEEDEDDHLPDVYYDDDVLALSPPSFVVDGWVPRGAFSVFWGKPGVFKTFLLNDMQRCVRRGAPWMTHRTRQGMTVMYQGEGLEQLQPRIEAWEQRYPLRGTQKMWPGVYLDRQPNISTPEGCARVARTVRGLERRHGGGKRVTLLIFDPLVEFMPVSDSGVEDMDPVSRGLRALAQYLGCAVVVGHHSNAEGARARGTDHLYMRCAAYVQMEERSGGRIGVVQHKSKNSARQGMLLKPEPYGSSVILEPCEALLAEDYTADRAAEAKSNKTAAAERKQTQAEGLIIAALEAEAGLAQDALLKACTGRGVGKAGLEAALAGLIADGRVRTEDGPRKAKKHYRVSA